MALIRFGEIGVELRLAAARLRRAPLIKAAAIVLLATALAAIGLSSRLYEVLLIEPFNSFDSNGLVLVAQRDGDTYSPALLPAVETWADRGDIFAGLSVFTLTGPATLATDGGDAAALTTCAVASNFFEVLQAKTVAGTSDLGGQQHAAVISYKAALKYFGASYPLGARLLRGGTVYEIVGVMPPAFRFPDAAVDLWIPIESDQNATPHMAVWGVGRLRQGVGSTRAERLLYTSDAAGTQRMSVVDLRSYLSRRWTLALGLVAVGALSLWLVVVTNVVGMNVTATINGLTSRWIRSVFGASEMHLAVGDLVENLMVVAVSLIVGAWGATILGQHLDLNTLLGYQVQERLVLSAFSVYCMAMAALATFLLTASSTSAFASWAVRYGTRIANCAAQGRERMWGSVLDVLVGAQVFGSVALCCAAALAARSSWSLAHVNLGFDPSGLVFATVKLPPTALRDALSSEAAWGGRVQLVEDLKAFGFDDVALTTSLPLDRSVGQVTVRRAAQGSDQARFEVQLCAITSAYFDVMKIELLAALSSGLTGHTQEPPAAIDAVLAKSLFGSADHAVGELIYILRRQYRVVAVTSAVRRVAMSLPPPPTVYVRYRDWPLPVVSVVTRIKGDTRIGVDKLRTALMAKTTRVNVARVEDMRSRIAQEMAAPFAATYVSATLAFGSLVVCLIGTHAAVGFRALTRRRDAAIMSALGATNGRIVRDILRNVVVASLLGSLGGIATGLALKSAARSLMFAPGDLDTVALTTAAVTVLVGVALAVHATARVRLRNIASALRDE